MRKSRPPCRRTPQNATHRTLATAEWRLRSPNSAAVGDTRSRDTNPRVRMVPRKAPAMATHVARASGWLARIRRGRLKATIVKTPCPSADHAHTSGVVAMSGSPMVAPRMIPSGATSAIAGAETDAGPKARASQRRIMRYRTGGGIRAPGGCAGSCLHPGEC